ncbi:hypothetical protein AAJ76_2600030604 [Vairimorpha ceranae]|uniref:Uncharacterized protein n=1 Tax=Vairimorpha ceranae TaxID=40302 RepID=A0A0F9WQR3_9MICR|nr:hypothetical protein AAJ76_2600030604 [Vairimorpha ceranae]KKO75273.1 hypothetical protein AAJ76_2600030604 [Vairimorpha ceranae]
MFREIATKEAKKSIWKESIEKIIEDFTKLNELINKYKENNIKDGEMHTQNIHKTHETDLLQVLWDSNPIKPHLLRLRCIKLRRTHWALSLGESLVIG